jgi:hypothetical protein
VGSFQITPGGPVEIFCGSSQDFTITITGTGASQFPGSSDLVNNAGLSVTDTVTNPNPPLGLGFFNFADSATIPSDDVWVIKKSFTVICTDTEDCHLELIPPGGAGTNPVTLPSGTATLQANFNALTILGAVVPLAKSNSVQVSCVTPEPSTMLLLGTGLIGIGVRLRKRILRSSSATIGA